MLKLADSSSTTASTIVYVYTGDETRLATSVLAIHAHRRQPADKNEFSLYKSAPGTAHGFAHLVLAGDDPASSFFGGLNNARGRGPGQPRPT